MKATVYLRIAKWRKGIRAEASETPTNLPIRVQDNYANPNERFKFLPTISFAVIFNIPDEVWNPADRIVAEIDLSLKNVKIAGDILLPEIKKAMANAAIKQLSR